MSEINNKSPSPLLPQQGGDQTDPAQEGFLAWIASADNPIRGMHDGEHPLPVTYRAGYAAGLAAVSQQGGGKQSVA